MTIKNIVLKPQIFIGIPGSPYKAIRKFQVWQEVWQRIPKAELANIPRIFQE